MQPGNGEAGGIDPKYRALARARNEAASKRLRTMKVCHAPASLLADVGSHRMSASELKSVSVVICSCAWCVCVWAEGSGACVGLYLGQLWPYRALVHLVARKCPPHSFNLASSQVIDLDRNAARLQATQPSNPRAVRPKVCSWLIWLSMWPDSACLCMVCCWDQP